MVSVELAMAMMAPPDAEPPDCPTSPLAATAPLAMNELLAIVRLPQLSATAPPMAALPGAVQMAWLSVKVQSATVPGPRSLSSAPPCARRWPWARLSSKMHPVSASVPLRYWISHERPTA